jgi:hypothetical protein
VGEALKNAKIDIVGGENDFFEKIVRAVGNGKSVDRMVNNSETLSDIKNTFFNGDVLQCSWCDDICPEFSQRLAALLNAAAHATPEARGMQSAAAGSRKERQVRLRSSFIRLG